MDYCILLLNETNETMYTSIISEDKKKLKQLFQRIHFESKLKV